MKKTKFSLIALALAMVASLGVGMTAFAEDLPAKRLQISPVVQKITLERGENYRSSIKVQNTGAEDFKYLVSATHYSVRDESYDPDFDSATSYSEMTNWITFDWTEGTAHPNDSIEVPLTISVPQDVPSGGQYAAIVAQIVNDDEGAGGNVGVTNIVRAAMLIFASVAGNTREQGEVIENNIPAFLFTTPLSVSSLVKNSGNVHADASYTLQVYPLFSDEEVYTNEEVPTTYTILPETQRYNTISWEGAPQLGIFRVVQTIKFLDKTSTNSRIVFICPMWFLILVLAFIFFCIFWVFARSRARKRAA